MSIVLTDRLGGHTIYADTCYPMLLTEEKHASNGIMMIVASGREDCLNFLDRNSITTHHDLWVDEKYRLYFEKNLFSILALDQVEAAFQDNIATLKDDICGYAEFYSIDHEFNPNTTALFYYMGSKLLNPAKHYIAVFSRGFNCEMERIMSMFENVEILNDYRVYNNFESSIQPSFSEYIQSRLDGTDATSRSVRSRS
jgi:hypothetical protein